MKPWSTLDRIAASLERLVQLGESYMQQQSLRVPQRAPTGDAPDENALSIYDPYLEGAREQRAYQIWQNGDALDINDAYQKAVEEEKQR